MSTEATTDTVVLLHGLWLTPFAWEPWVAHLEQKGMQVITPGYPGIEPDAAGVTAIRNDPSPLAGLGLGETLDHLKGVIGALDTAPIIMGHSFGGAFVQLLLDAGFGSAGVSINGAGVKGILALPPNQLKSVWHVLKNPANRKRAVQISEEQFHDAFANNLDEDESKAVYDRYAIPVSGRMLFQAGLANVTPNAATTINFKNDDRAPLLFIAGGNDKIVPSAVQRENFRKNSRQSSATTAFKLFQGRSHYTCGEPGWEAVADFAFDWARAPTPGELS